MFEYLADTMVHLLLLKIPVASSSSEKQSIRRVLSKCPVDHLKTNLTGRSIGLVVSVLAFNIATRGQTPSTILLMILI